MEKQLREISQVTLFFTFQIVFVLCSVLLLVSD